MVELSIAYPHIRADTYVCITYILNIKGICWMHIYLYRYVCNSHHYSSFVVDVEKCTARIFNSSIAKRMSVVRMFSSSHLNKQGK